MKKIFFTLSVILLFTACDTIPENERIIEVDSITPSKTVLLEDFTGWKCPNCPLAAILAHTLQQTYGHHVIVVSMHPDDGHWTLPAGDALDLRSAAATEYFHYYGAPGAFPIGMIDRYEFNAGNTLYDRDYWTTYVKMRLIEKSSAEITMTIDRDQDISNNLIINVSITASDAWEEEYSLMLWLTESGIVGPQFDGGIVNKTYVHNHVMRDAINGTWGQSVLQPAVGESTQIAIEYLVDGAYHIDNCDVVAVLYKNSNKEVVTAHSVAL